MSYGLLQPEDIAVIESSLAELMQRGVSPIRLLEIGAYKGDTALGIKEFLERHGFGIDYWGIEPGLLGYQALPFSGANMIYRKSEEAFHLVPDGLDLVFVDGDHTRNAVILDIFNYAPKVLPGGFMVFHDTAPKMQGIIVGNHHGYCHPGCPDIAEFYCAVLDAFRLIKWPWAPWTLFKEGYCKEELYGARSYRNGP